MTTEEICKHYLITAQIMLNKYESATFNMQTRTDLLNYLAEKYNLQHYLEIGCQTNVNFNAINCRHKVSVDPDPEAHASFCLTSDQFFEQVLDTEYYGAIKPTPLKFDLIFIDGLHEATQVERDFMNSCQVIKPGGFIVLHDCNPENEQNAKIPRETKVWNGDVFQFATKLFMNDFVTIDIDHGCGVYRHKGDPIISKRQGKLRWEEFASNRKDALNLISWVEFLEKY